MRSKSLALMMQQSRSLRVWPLLTNCTSREGYAPGQWGGTSTERVMTSSPRITSPLLTETYHTRHGMRSCDAVNRSATRRSSDRASCFSLFIGFFFFATKINNGDSHVKDKNRHCVHYYVRKDKKKHRSSKSYNRRWRCRADSSDARRPAYHIKYLLSAFAKVRIFLDTTNAARSLIDAAVFLIAVEVYKCSDNQSVTRFICGGL